MEGSNIVRYRKFPALHELWTYMERALQTTEKTLDASLIGVSMKRQFVNGSQSFRNLIVKPYPRSSCTFRACLRIR